MNHNNQSEYINPYEAEKICSYCGKKFYSKFNKDRHEDDIHLKVNLRGCPICHRLYNDIEKHIEKCKNGAESKPQETIKNSFIGFKHYLIEDKNISIEDNEQQKIMLKDKIENKPISLNEENQIDN